MITHQEKKDYILNNIDKYFIDSRGNFFHTDSEMMNDDRYYIGKDIFTPEEKQEIIDKWVKKVVENKEDWEIIYAEVEDPSPTKISNKKTGHQLTVCPSGFNLNLILGNLIGWENYHFLLKELGDSVENRKKFGDYVKRKNEKREEFFRLKNLILSSQDLPVLEENYKIVKNNPLYSRNIKIYDDEDDNKTKLDNEYCSRKKFLVSLGSSNNHHKNNEKLNDLKIKFHQIYQKGKKYTLMELHRLREIIRLTEKETSLNDFLREGKNELESIFSKLASCECKIYFLGGRGEKVEDMLKDLDNYQLESCKKAFEEMAEIIHLSEWEKHLFESINNKLKVINLESEIKELESQKTDNPRQRLESQQKIEQKKKEIDKVKEEQKKKTNNPPPKLPQSEENQKNWVYEQAFAEIQKLKDQNNKTELKKRISQLKEIFKQLEKEVNQLKTEIQELKAKKDNSPEHQSYLAKKEVELQDKQQKLDQLKSIIETTNNSENKPKPNNFPTGLVVGGGILIVAVVGLIGIVVLKVKRNRKRK